MTETAVATTGLMAQMGIVFAVLGLVLAALLPGIGSSIGVGIAGQAAAGAMADNPSLFGKLLILQLLPGTQGIYGLIVAFVGLALGLNVIGGSGGNITLVKGLAYFGACMPMAVVGLISAIQQAKASIASIHLLAKRPDQFGKAMIFPAMVETYAILALLVSILSVIGVGTMNI